MHFNKILWPLQFLLVSFAFANFFNYINSEEEKLLSKEEFTVPPFRQLGILIKAYNATLNVIDKVCRLLIYINYDKNTFTTLYIIIHCD